MPHCSESKRSEAAFEFFAHRRTMLPLLLLVGALPALPSGLRCDEAKLFFENHCYDCHSDETAKGDLRIDMLSTDSVTADSVKTWGRILARLEAGEMPPPHRERPPSGEVDAFLRWSKHALAAEARVRRSAGRTSIRRLNRLEHERTLQDLLAVELPLRELLPPDEHMDGFNTVTAALRISPVLIQRSMEAADAALQAAITRTASSPTRVHRLSYDDDRAAAFIQKQHRTRRAQFQRHRGEMRFFIEPGEEHPASLHPFADITREAPGRYRVRVAAHSLNVPPGHNLAFGIRTASSRQRLGIEQLGWFETKPGNPLVFEVEAWFDPGETILVEPYRLHDLRRALGYSQYTQEPPNDAPAGPALVVSWVEVEGPLHAQWPSEGHVLLFGGVPQIAFKDLPPDTITPGSLAELRGSENLTPHSSDPAADARRLLGAFLPRAFRRPVTEEELVPWIALVRERIAQRECFESAMLAAYRTALCSPDFLFRFETPGALDSHALAARLSYFLWRTAPDDALRAAADRGELQDSATLWRETERLLDSPRAQAFVADFLDQWLHLREFDATQPDTRLYPEFHMEHGGGNFKEDGLLKHSMVEETRLFFADLLARDASVLELIDSRHTFLNRRLAAFYQMPPVSGLKMRHVTLPADSPRGGVLTQASVLKVTANGTRTSPIVRGVWVLENILGRKPSPPPADAGSIDPDTRGSTTIREQLALHQSSKSCASCHRQIDPPGFALEAFDPSGQWRTTYRTLDGANQSRPARPQPAAAPGQDLRVRDLLGPTPYIYGRPVDASGQLLDGRSFDGPRQFKQLLLQEPRTVVRCLASKLATYATGHATEPGDILALDAIVNAVEPGGYGLRSLLHAVIQSALFRAK